MGFDASIEQSPVAIPMALANPPRKMSQAEDQQRYAE